MPHRHTSSLQVIVILNVTKHLEDAQITTLRQIVARPESCLISHTFPEPQSWIVFYISIFDKLNHHASRVRGIAIETLRSLELSSILGRCQLSL